MCHVSPDRLGLQQHNHELVEDETCPTLCTCSFTSTVYLPARTEAERWFHRKRSLYWKWFLFRREENYSDLKSLCFTMTNLARGWWQPLEWTPWGRNEQQSVVCCCLHYGDVINWYKLLLDVMWPEGLGVLYMMYLGVNPCHGFLCTEASAASFLQYFISVTVLAMVPELPEIVNGIQFALQNNISLRFD